jgi:hypothetical protein
LFCPASPGSNPGALTRASNFSPDSIGSDFRNAQQIAPGIEPVFKSGTMAPASPLEEMPANSFRQRLHFVDDGRRRGLLIINSPTKDKAIVTLRTCNPLIPYFWTCCLPTLCLRQVTSAINEASLNPG